MLHKKIEISVDYPLASVFHKLAIKSFKIGYCEDRTVLDQFGKSFLYTITNGQITSRLDCF